MSDQGYKKAFFIAVFLHVFLGIMLFTEASNERLVLTQEAKNEPGEINPVAQSDQPKAEIVKAVSVDSKQVMETVNRLKQERAMQQKAEQARQQALNKQAEMARKERMQEQQKLAKLKEESAKLAIARKKQLEEEQKHLKELAIQKVQESKRLEELKSKQQQLEKKQAQESAKLAELKRKQAEELTQAESSQAEKVSAELERQKQAVAEQQAAANSAKKAQLAGEVNKYKAMILDAIGRRWILPENVDSTLSSQFHIRLAPDGAVLEVSLTKSSGDPILDRSAQTAIYKASPLPVPNDSDTFNVFRDITLTVRPQNVRG